MKRVLFLMTAGVLAALIALSPMSNAFAQGRGAQAAGQARWGGPAQSLVGMAAAQLGMSQAELVAQLRNGASIAEVMRAKGGDPAKLVEAFVASRAERLEAAVAAGRLTRAEADARLATVRAMVTARIEQPFSVLGPGGRGAGQNFVDRNGDGVCDNLPAGGQGRQGAGPGPRR